MKHLTVKTSVVALSLTFAFGGVSAYAFDDVTSDTQVQMLQALRDQGIVKGVSSNKFNPAGTLSEAQGIQMIVNAFDLSAGNEKTEPGNLKWYHAAYDAARAEGLSLPAIRDAEEALTREIFANLLFEGINTTGEYPVILLYNHIKDEQEIKPEYISSIQNLLNMKVTSLGDEEQFRPRDTLTRMEAAEMVYQAREFIDRHGSGGGTDETPGTVPGSGQQAMVPEVSSQTIDEKTVKVKISLELPNPGYGLEIKDVELSKNGKAIIKYEIIQPDPNKMYPQVITERSAETNIPSGYTPEVAPFS
ncbi:S-layer homology domain-containing protein [Paenibacillus gallinarum]|uniref:Protease complex subunit PrcB family protein n=1 Tax=Paenibacillus gallinarum TaxID=2762232 RepID=A0ABR8T4A3_9BACL|nr:S-layer homology domain-containing protein [Paenibacillus gallinarum]MBD7970614.1 protease complex subunit PrcB family protein [Paenibacillus gallinarum]